MQHACIWLHHKKHNFQIFDSTIRFWNGEKARCNYDLLLLAPSLAMSFALSFSFYSIEFFLLHTWYHLFFELVFFVSSPLLFKNHGQKPTEAEIQRNKVNIPKIICFVRCRQRASTELKCGLWNGGKMTSIEFFSFQKIKSIFSVVYVCACACVCVWWLNGCLLLLYFVKRWSWIHLFPIYLFGSYWWPIDSNSAHNCFDRLPTMQINEMDNNNGISFFFLSFFFRYYYYFCVSDKIANRKENTGWTENEQKRTV